MTAVFPDYYDEPKYDYRRYWDNRDYEDQAEKLVLQKFFSLIDKKAVIADLGGGFGRLSCTYSNIFNQCYLIDSSEKMLGQAQQFCRKITNIKIKKGSLNKIPLADKSVDVALNVRTLHHLPELDFAFQEIARIIRPSGYLVLEYPNKMHIKNIIKNALLLRFSFFNLKPENIATKNKVPFYNFHPRHIHTLLKHNKFHIITHLSVSNFRSPVLKRLIPTKLLLVLEAILQPFFSPFYTGPSIFILAKKGA